MHRANEDSERFSLHSAQEATDESRTARMQIEQLLAGLWAQLLGLNDISVNDDLLGLGATSLMAMQVVSRLRRILGYKVPMNIILELTTVSDLASALLEYESRNRPRCNDANTPNQGSGG